MRADGPRDAAGGAKPGGRSEDQQPILILGRPALPASEKVHAPVQGRMSPRVTNSEQLIGFW